MAAAAAACGPTTLTGETRTSQRVRQAHRKPLFADCAHLGHIGHMRKMSLADAKARISELVDLAEHRGQRVVILRHGKPAAAIVPVEVALPKRRRQPRMTQVELEQSIQAYIAEFSASEPESSAVDDLLAGRR